MSVLCYVAARDVTKFVLYQCLYDVWKRSLAKVINMGWKKFSVSG